MIARGKVAAWCVAISMILPGVLSRPACAQTPGDLDGKVGDAMQRAVDFLLKKKKKDNWEYGTAGNGDPKWWDRSFKGGETALVLYALLHAGESLEDPRLKANSPELAPVIKWLCEQKPDTVYGAAFRANALSMCAYLKLPEVRRALLEDQKYLMGAMRVDGGFTYSLDEFRKESQKLQREATTRKWVLDVDPLWDNSNAQYAALAMWATNEALGESPKAFWTLADAYWRKKQHSDGGWAYDAKWRPKSTPQMNLAGLASLYITGDFVGYKRRDPAFANAWAAIEKDFRPDRDDYYYMYGLERVGLATGMKTIGSVEWYPAVARHMIKRQEAGGSWICYEGERGDGGNSQVVATSYALVFLARGRNPVVFNKLAYGGMDSQWDTSPRDNANVTAWMSKTFERPLNWQVVKIQTEPEQWLDSPILVISGGNDPKFSGEEIEKIRKFVNAGGIVLSYADAQDKGFTQAIIKSIAPEIVQKKYEMRELPKDHAILNGQLAGKIAVPPRMQIMSNGARVVWFHAEIDLGATWHSKRTAQRDQWTLASNLYLYAAGHQSLRNKLQGLVVAPSPDRPTRTVSLARLDYAANSDPEPGAWPRMAKLAQAQFHTDLQLSTHNASELGAFTGPIVHMTGTTRFSLTSEQIGGLKAFLGRGGLLFADAAGGSRDFSISFQALLKELAPDGTLISVPADDRLYNGSMNESVKLPEVTYRRSTGIVGPSKPRLKGIQKTGRWSILLSEEDVTSGLLGTDTWGISGYSPQSSQALARNILLYGAGAK